MKERNENTNTVQNRFTAYLVISVKNKRISYMERKYKLHAREYACEEIADTGMDSFESQFCEYINRQAAEQYGNPAKILEILKEAENGRIMKAVGKLKEKEQKLLFGRIFGEQSFSELGRMLGMTPKQAEMAYYYVVRKIRKGNL